MTSILSSMATQASLISLTGGAALPLLRDNPYLAVVGGHTEHLTPLALVPPPAISLRTDDRHALLQMLGYAGIHYRDAKSPASDLGIQVFQTARDFVGKAKMDLVTFDWDHTISNYQIYRELVPMIRAKMSKKKPTEKASAAPMIAIEAPRPFMQELVFGMMVGFAIKQGLGNFDEWKNYRPQVGLSTHTWPDRIGVLGAWFIRLIPLMEGLLPGEEGIYENLVHPDAKAFLNLHHFLGYADRLMARLDRDGFQGMSPGDKAEVLAYLTDGKAHYRKPLGASAEKWGTRRVLHFDDLSKVIVDLQTRREEGAAGILVQNPWTKPGKDVGELKKIHVPGLWQSPETAVSGVVEKLAKAELGGSSITQILGALSVLGDNTSDPDSLLVRHDIPEGAVLAVYETPTTVGEFWKYYVEPTNALKTRVRAVRKAHKQRMLEKSKTVGNQQLR